jgi:hypothetical protein
MSDAPERGTVTFRRLDDAVGGGDQPGRSTCS